MFLPRLKNINLQEFAAAILLLLVINSCNKGDPYLYDRTGFDRDARPVVAPNPNVRTSAPEYYQQQPQYGNSYQQVPLGYAPASPYPQQYQNQQVPLGYAPIPSYPPQYQQGGSRYYSNPYAIPPANNYYPQRYDVDQYYVPPTYYNNVEPIQSKRGSHVNSTGSTNY